MTKKKKPIVRITQWYVIDFYFYSVLKGIVFGHPKIQDGHHIVSSKIVKMNENEGYAETWNTHYILEEKLIEPPDHTPDLGPF